jgi:IS1 family transposase
MSSVWGRASRNSENSRPEGDYGTASGKAIVVGAVKRKGSAVARVIKSVSRQTLEHFVRESVSTKVSLHCTDQWVGYRHLDKEIPHQVIDHSASEYVVGAVHTYTIVFLVDHQARHVGTFHKVSKSTCRSMSTRFNSAITTA